MIKYIKENPNTLLILLLILWTLLNLVTAHCSNLIGDEAYYWFISKNLSWGYFDHPPLFALFNYLGVQIYGNTEIGSRLLTVITQPLYLYLFWTIVRTEKSDYKSAIRYFLILFSIPMLHVYGFVATPDGPLLLSVVVTLYAFKKFTHSTRFADNGYLLSILLLALGFTLMAYAKYHGALVVIAIIISRPKLLIDWRFYLVSLITLALYTPHFIWQYDHDFVSFNYHLIQRNSDFEFKFIPEYIGNFIGVYNPFLTIPFSIMLFRRSPFVKNPMERLFRIMGLFLLLFFLYTTSRGHVQPQWLLPICFPIVYFMARSAENSKGTARYITNSSIFMGLVILAIHIVIIVVKTPFIDSLEFFGRKEAKRYLQDEIGSASLLITDGNYTRSSYINFYTTLPSYAYPNMYSRSNHYEFLNDLDQYYGKKVAVEINHPTVKANNRDSLKAQYKCIEHPYVGDVLYQVVESYIPTYNVKINLQSFPAKVLTDQNLALTLQIHNPYDYEIRLGKEDGFNIIMHIQSKREEDYWDIELPFNEQTIGSNGNISIATSVQIPKLPTDEYRVGFTLRKDPQPSWYNSEVFKLLIVNPRTRV